MMGGFRPSFWVLFRGSCYLTGHQLNLRGLQVDGIFLPTSCTDGAGGAGDIQVVTRGSPLLFLGALQ